LIKQRPIEDALIAAQRKWEGTEFSRGESEDPHYALCFGKVNPLDDAFQIISTNVFNLLLDHCSEILI